MPTVVVRPIAILVGALFGRGDVGIAGRLRYGGCFRIEVAGVFMSDGHAHIVLYGFERRFGNGNPVLFAVCFGLLGCDVGIVSANGFQTFAVEGIAAVVGFVQICEDLVPGVIELRG
jgi:hypothetical protein